MCSMHVLCRHGAATKHVSSRAHCAMSRADLVEPIRWQQDWCWSSWSMLQHRPTLTPRVRKVSPAEHTNLSSTESRANGAKRRQAEARIDTA